MSTTTIRLSDDLKAKMMKEAEALGTTPHNFMLEAIAEKLNLADRKNDFTTTAAKRFDAIVKTGQAIEWEDMQRYLSARAKGHKVARPKNANLSASSKTVTK
jgi:predicted transcriptional regulator